MSQKHPECPLYNPLNCKEYYNPKLCAFARKDRMCLKKKRPGTKKADMAAAANSSSQTEASSSVAESK